MSALGHYRTNHRRPKSTVVRFGPKADKRGYGWIVRYVPKAVVSLHAMNSRPSRSFDLLDFRIAYYLAPFRGFICDELAEFRRRHRHWHAAEIGETSFQFWIC